MTITADKAKELLASFDRVTARDDEVVSVRAGELRELLRAIVDRDESADRMRRALRAIADGGVWNPRESALFALGEISR